MMTAEEIVTRLAASDPVYTEDGVITCALCGFHKDASDMTSLVKWHSPKCEFRLASEWANAFYGPERMVKVSDFVTVTVDLSPIKSEP